MNISDLRHLEFDHAPDGYPAVQMRSITYLLNRIDAGEVLADAAEKYFVALAKWMDSGGLQDGRAARLAESTLKSKLKAYREAINAKE